MTTIDRAAEVIKAHQDMTDRSALDGCTCGDPGVGGVYCQHLAQALADAGLLAPEPHVVTSVEELRNLPDGTVIKCANYRRVVQKLQGYWYFTGAVEFHVNSRELLPATVLTPAPAPRATVTREDVRRWIERVSEEYLDEDEATDAILALLKGDAS